MTKSLLKIENISVAYGNIIALRNVSLTVAEGEIVSLIGANGAGKSTLLKSIVGLVPLSEGSIYYSDKNLANLQTFKLAEMGISLVPEGRRVFSDLTVEENLDMGAFSVKDEKLINKRKQENVWATVKYCPWSLVVWLRSWSCRYRLFDCCYSSFCCKE